MGDSCIKAAKEAAAKVNAMLLATGQWKPSESNKPTSKSEKATNLFVEEVVINDAPMSARNYLTRSSTQEEISTMSGASVSTRGRYMSQGEAEKSSNTSNDKPLHLHIQGANEQDVKVAVGRIMHLIMEHTHRKNQPHQKFRGHRQNSNSSHHERSPSKTIPANVQSDVVKPNQPFPHPQNVLREKVFLPMNVGLDPIEVRHRLLGEYGTNMKYIEDEAGISVLLCGVGSGMLDPKTQQESPEPLHFYIEHPNAEQFNQAKDLVVNLVQTILPQMQQEQQQQQQQQIPTQPPPVVPPISQDIAAAPARPQTVGPQILPQTGLPPPPPPHLTTGVATINGSSIIQQPQSVLQAQMAPYPQQIVIPQAPQLPPSSLAPMATPQPVSQSTSYPSSQTASLVFATHPVVNQTIATPQVAELTSTPSTTQVLQISVPGAVSGAPVVSQQLIQTSSGPQLVQIPHGAQIVSTPEGPRLVTFAPANASVPAALPVQPALPCAAPEIQAAAVPHSASVAPQALQYIPGNSFQSETESARFNSTAPPTSQTTTITYFQPAQSATSDASTMLLPSAPQATLAVPPPAYAPPLAVPVQPSSIQAASDITTNQVTFTHVPISQPEMYQVPLTPASSISSVGFNTCTTTTLSQPTVTYQEVAQQGVVDWRSYPVPRSDVPTQNFVDVQHDTNIMSKPAEAVMSVANKDSLLPWAQYPQSSDEADEIGALRTSAAHESKSTSLYPFPHRLLKSEALAG